MRIPKLLFPVVLILFLLLIANKAEAIFFVSSTTPAQNDTNFGRNPTFIINFPIVVCSYMGTTYIKKTSDDSVIDTINMFDYSGSGTQTISFTSHVQLDSNTSYYLDLAVGAVSDCAPGFTNTNASQRVDFTTGTCTSSGMCTCYNPPSCIGPCFGSFTQVKHLSPPDNGHFMQSYEGINIIFNGNVSLGSGNIYIRKFSDDTTIETIDVTSNRVSGWGTSSINIDPIANLSNDTQYYVNFDVEGYSLSSDKNKWNFWTKSTPNTFTGSGF